ncbi:MAG: hypothetical protein HY934_08645, partial [Candidatus Firestonebacteria bacterium]|nr:hypothetical protein [Candidatus Firestonebacteria bacterium]
MFKKQKENYLILSIISILVGITGFFTLLLSPYLGIEFESRNNKWFISSASSPISAADSRELIGKEVISINDFKLHKFDLV